MTYSSIGNVDAGAGGARCREVVKQRTMEARSAWKGARRKSNAAAAATVGCLVGVPTPDGARDSALPRVGNEDDDYGYRSVRRYLGCSRWGSYLCGILAEMEEGYASLCKDEHKAPKLNNT